MKLQQKNIDDIIPFLQLFVDEVEDDRQEILLFRKRMNVKIGICVFVIIILIVAFIYLNQFYLYSWIIYCKVGSLFGVVLLFNQIEDAFSKRKHLKQKYKETFKNELYSIITSTLQPNWNYKKDVSLFSMEDFAESKIFSDNVEGLWDDYSLEGQFNSNPLELNKICIATYDNKVQAISNYYGIFLKITFANHVDNKAIITPRITSQNSTSNSLHKLNLHQKGYELYNENELTFNRYFKIYNTQNYALPEMLTPTFQRQLAHFVLNHKKEIYLSFQKNKLYISIKTDLESILPSLKGDVSTKAAAENFYDELQIVLDLLKRMQ